eukprot:1890552-Pyramimonas_sp.AAC.1
MYCPPKRGPALHGRVGTFCQYSESARWAALARGREKVLPRLGEYVASERGQLLGTRWRFY